MLRDAKSIEGYELRARDGIIGRVRDVYFDDEKWTVRYLVVDAGSWLTGRTVLIAAAAIKSRDWDLRLLEVELTKEQVKNSPHVDTEKPVSRQQEEDIHRYYAWPYYWADPPLASGTGYVAPISPAAVPARGAGPAPPQDERRSTVAEDVAAARTRQGDPHLRSVNAIRGYTVQAQDGAAGHVEDFILDDDSWALRGLVVDTRNWWPGGHVLLPLANVTEISWLERRLYLAETREAIKAAPAFDGRRPIPADYVDRLAAHRRPRSRRDRDGSATSS